MKNYVFYTMQYKFNNKINIWLVILYTTIGDIWLNLFYCQYIIRYIILIIICMQVTTYIINIEK